VVPEVFGSISTYVRRQYVIIILISPVIAGQLIYNNTNKGIAIKVDLGGSLAYNRFKILLENIFKAVRAIKKRVVGEIYRRNDPKGNIFSLISKAPSTAKL